MSAVELRRLPDGRWAWTYRDEHVALHSNDVYDSEKAAEESAKSAYPGVPITRTIEEQSSRPKRSKGGLAFLLMVWAVWRRTRGER